METMNNERIFKQSFITSVKGVRFGNNKIQCETKGAALYHPNYGYLSFGNNIDENGIELPYIPAGGRKVLKEIKASGLLDYKCIRWIKPCKAI